MILWFNTAQISYWRYAQFRYLRCNFFNFVQKTKHHQDVIFRPNVLTSDADPSPLMYHPLNSPTAHTPLITFRYSRHPWEWSSTCPVHIPHLWPVLGDPLNHPSATLATQTTSAPIPWPFFSFPCHSEHPWPYYIPVVRDDIWQRVDGFLLRNWICVRKFSQSRQIAFTID